MNGWIFFAVFTVVLQLTAPYSNNDFTLELNIRIFVLVDRYMDVHISLSCRKADLALLTQIFYWYLSLLFDEAAKMGESFHLFKRLAFKLHGGCAGSVYLHYVALARWMFRPIFFQFSVTLAFAVGCARRGLSRPQSPGHQTESKVLTVCHSVSVLWMSS